MDKLNLILAMQQPEILPLLLLLDDGEDYGKKLADVSIDTTSVDFSTDVVNIDATVTPADADLRTAQVIATSKNYSAKILYDEVDSKHILQLERTIDKESACEVYVQVDGVNILDNAENSDNYFIFNYDPGA